jgi:hypothetical protein
MGYPAQLKPPLGPQLLLEAFVELERDTPRDPTFDIFLWVSSLSHFGQAGARSASEKRTIFSKASPQSSHRYSYMGIE